MKKKYIIILKIFFISLSIFSYSFSQDYKILESNDNHITLEFSFINNFIVIDTLIDGIKFSFIKDSQYSIQEPGKPLLPTRYYNIGLPYNSNAKVVILDFDREVLKDKFIISTPDSANQPLNKLNYNEEIYGVNLFYPVESVLINSQNIYRFIKTASIQISPFQFNPVERTLIYNKRIKVRIDFQNDQFQNANVIPSEDKLTKEFVKNNLINNNQAINFIGSLQKSLSKIQGEYWYNPNKNYYKIYLEKEGVYRLTYNFLNSAGVPIQNLSLSKIQLFNNGIEIPLYVHDANNNNFFDIDDYCEFVGLPPNPSPYSYLNIYNTKNIYWFSYEADSSGKRYNLVNGFPTTWINSYSATPFTIHYEEDKIYERLGHSPDDKRDYWYWGKASGLNGSLLNTFSAEFPSPKNMSTSASSLKILVNLQGMTTETCLTPDHRIKFALTSQPIGELTFDGPITATFETTVNFSEVGIFPTNNMQVYAYGDIPVNPCSPSSSKFDEVRVNWFEVEYLRDHRADANNFSFETPPDANGLTRFGVFNWLRDNMRILIPGKSDLIT